jgi:hypothetical protein
VELNRSKVINKPEIHNYLDRDGNLVCKTHRYLRPDGSLAASGKEDPKRVLRDGAIYILDEDL